MTPTFDQSLQRFSSCQSEQGVIRKVSKPSVAWADQTKPSLQTNYLSAERLQPSDFALPRWACIGWPLVSFRRRHFQEPAAMALRVFRAAVELRYVIHVDHSGGGQCGRPGCAVRVPAMLPKTPYWKTLPSTAIFADAE